VPRLLVIEDDINTRSGLVELLKEEGYEVQGANRGQEAINIISNCSMDLVLCDYSLPDIDGLSACREMKRLQPELVTFLITGFYNSELIRDARAIGITKIFTKPLVLDDLFQIIFSYSKQRPSVADPNSHE